MEEYAPFNESEFNRWLSDSGDSTLRLNYDLNENSTVFDLGGYRGEWTKQIFNKYKSNIFIFEPVDEFYNIICQTIGGNPKIQPYKFGLSSKEETIEISLTKDSSSVFNTDGTKEKIQLNSAVEFINSNNIDTIDLIKINIEGGEYDVLESIIENNMQDKLKNIQVQFHRFIPECVERREKIRTELSKTHELTYDYEFVWENWKLK
jgi:FkbM family methyltransferase